jgi:putative acetyltransferase
MIYIRKETPADYDDIRYVNRRAFGQEAEGRLVDELRNKNMSVLSQVAVEDDTVIGHIMFSPVTVKSDSNTFEAIALAPMSVLPEYQRKGIGSQLVTAGLEECRRMGYEVVFVLGHSEYYPRFGFVPARGKGINCEFEVPDDAWMVLELKPDTLAGRTGTVIYQPEFREAA